MQVLGEQFYNMTTLQPMTNIDLSQVAVVTVEEVTIECVDVENEATKSIEVVYFVRAILLNGDFVATRPQHNLNKAEIVALAFIDLVKKANASRLN